MINITRNSKSFKLIINLNDDDVNMEQICEIWQNIIEESYKKNHICIKSSIVHKSKIVNNKDWGLPEGEDIFVVTGTFNVHLDKDIDKWVESVKDCVEILMKMLQQSSAYLEIYDIELTYFENK